MTDLNEVSTDDLIAELKARDELTQSRITEFDDWEIQNEYDARKMGGSDFGATLQDVECLDKAVDYARWGDLGLCGHFLIAAIPGLWPLRKVLGA